MLDFRAPSSSRAPRAVARLPFYSRLMEILFLLQVIRTPFFFFFLLPDDCRLLCRPRDRFNFISSKLPLYDTFVFIRSPVGGILPCARASFALVVCEVTAGETVTVKQTHKAPPPGRLYKRLYPF